MVAAAEPVEGEAGNVGIAGMLPEEGGDGGGGLLVPVEGGIAGSAKPVEGAVPGAATEPLFSFFTAGGGVAGSGGSAKPPSPVEGDAGGLTVDPDAGGIGGGGDEVPPGAGGITKAVPGAEAGGAVVVPPDELPGGLVSPLTSISSEGRVRGAGAEAGAAASGCLGGGGSCPPVSQLVVGADAVVGAGAEGVDSGVAWATVLSSGPGSPGMGPPLNLLASTTPTRHRNEHDTTSPTLVSRVMTLAPLVPNSSGGFLLRCGRGTGTEY